MISGCIEGRMQYILSRLNKIQKPFDDGRRIQYPCTYVTVQYAFTGLGFGFLFFFGSVTLSGPLLGKNQMHLARYGAAFFRP